MEDVCNGKARNNHFDCYYVKCKINGQLYNGYVDTGCTGVILRERAVNQLKIKMKSCSNTIEGYTGHTASIGKVIVNLMHDLAQEEVEPLVVRDELQAVPILIGQSFINKNKTLMVKNNQMRLISDDKLKDVELETLHLRKIPLHADGDAVVPPSA